MKVFDFVVASGQRGKVIAESIPTARSYLMELNLKPTTITYSFRSTVNLFLGGGLTIQRRNLFWRILQQRLSDDVSPGDCLEAMTLSVQDIVLLQACYKILWAIREGQSFYKAAKNAGFPDEDVNTIRIGESSGNFLESIHSLENETAMLNNLKRSTVSSLYGAIAAVTILFIIMFLAIAGLLPHVHDTLIVPTGAKKSLSPTLLLIFDFSLAVKNALPFSAIAYYGTPVAIWFILRALQITTTDIISIFPPAKQLFIKIDMLRAVQIMSRFLRFKSGFLDAVGGVPGSMKTRQMQDGFAIVVQVMGQGATLTDACHRSVLPIDFCFELAHISRSKKPLEYLEKYATVIYNDIPPLGEFLKSTVTIFALVFATLMIFTIISLTYLPIIKAALAISSQ